jgi:hypothetical protein
VYTSSVGSNDSSVTVHATGGTAPLQFSLNGGAYQADSLFTGLSAGTDTVSVTDANMCTPALEIFTIADKVMTIDSIITTQITCNAETGGLCVYASGGVGPLSYQWTGGPSDQCWDNIAAGDYTITITDANNMSIDTLITLVEPPLFILDSINIAWDTINSIGTITVAITGGKPDYTYTLSGAQSMDSTIPDTVLVFTDLTGGDYTVTVDDANNCGPFDSSIVALDIIDFSMAGDLKLYPNPTTGEFTVEFDNAGAEDVMLEIVNMTGQLVFKKLHKYNGNPRFIETIDLRRQAKGAYLLRMNGMPVKSKLMIK